MKAVGFRSFGGVSPLAEGRELKFVGFAGEDAAHVAPRGGA